MSTIEEIERAVTDLAPDELSRFRTWFLAYDARVWDLQVETDVAAGRLDALADEALAEFRAGQTRPL